MIIQLRFLRDDGQGNPLAERMIRIHFDDVVHRRYNKLARALSISPDKARANLEYIRTHLYPYPAAQFRPPWQQSSREARSSVRPDVYIRRTEFGYEVDVAGVDQMSLGITSHYREAYMRIKQARTRVTEEERKHVTEYVERAELFIKTSSSAVRLCD